MPTHFDALWINMPSELQDTYFYFIPSGALLQQEIFQTPTTPGKMSLRLYPPGTPTTRKARDCWANEFCFAYADEHVIQKIEAVFAKYPTGDLVCQ
jgi:hypothetical protein